LPIFGENFFVFSNTNAMIKFVQHFEQKTPFLGENIFQKHNIGPCGARSVEKEGLVLKSSFIPRERFFQLLKFNNFSPADAALSDTTLRLKTIRKKTCGVHFMKHFWPKNMGKN
jgi:hypothetical protein